MPNLNLDLDYFEHRDTKRLIGRLGKGAEVLPLKLWAYTGKHHAEDGRLSGYSESEIGSIVGWWREPGELVKAMLDMGFLGQDDRGFYVVQWMNRQGHLRAFKERAQAAAAVRWSKLVASADNATSNALSIAKGDDKQCPKPSSTKPAKEPPAPKGVWVIPKALESPEFEEAWTRWQEHRKEIRHALKPTSGAAQLKKLEKFGLAKALASIEESISNGWQGLFEPKPAAVSKIRPTSAQLDAQQRQEKDRQQAALRERERARADAERRIQEVKSVAPHELERLRQACIRDANDFVKPKIQNEDPLGGGMLTTLIFARLQTERVGAA
jgi:hypothetical protein